MRPLLTTFVVCPGVLYGAGEVPEGFLSLMRAAWEVGPDGNCSPRHKMLATSETARVTSETAFYFEETRDENVCH